MKIVKDRFDEETDSFCTYDAQTAANCSPDPIRESCMKMLEYVVNVASICAEDVNDGDIPDLNDSGEALRDFVNKITNLYSAAVNLLVIRKGDLDCQEQKD